MTASRLRAMFKPKIRRDKQPMPVAYYLILIILAVTILNFALLFPPQLTALWFEFELLVIQFLKTPVHLQLWFFSVLIFITAWVGWFVMPVIEVPYTKDRFFYTRRWQEGSMMIFKALNGRYIIVNRELVRNRWKRFFIMFPVARNPIGNHIIYETTEMEVSLELKYQRYAEALAEELASLYAEKERSETRLSLEEVIAIVQARRGGGDE